MTVSMVGWDSLLPCGSESARRRHLAHGQPCRACWPATVYPRMPDSTMVPGWLAELIAEEFGADDPPEELIA